MPKIRFWSTIGDAYGFVFGDLARLLRLAWFWWLAALVFGVGGGAAASRLGVIERHYGLWLLDGLILMPIISAFAVACHRAVLLDGNPPWTSIHLKAREWRYAFFVLVIMALNLAPWVPSIALRLSGAGVGENAKVAIGAFALVAIAVDIGLAAIAVRFSLYLPAISIERPLTLGESWRLTRRNTFRLIGGSFLTITPVSFVKGFIGGFIKMFVSDSSLAGAIFLGMLDMAGSVLEAAVSVCFLSFVYRQLTSQAATEPAGELSPVADPV